MGPRDVVRSLAGNLFLTLGLLLGVMQTVVGHWLLVVAPGRQGPGWTTGLVFATCLVAANGAAIPALRRARRGQGAARPLANLYMSLGVATLLLGLVLTAAWLGFLPIAGVLHVVGIGGETGFLVFRVLTAGVVVTLVGLLLWGFTIGRVRIERSHQPVTLPGLSADLRGLRIVQISDLHIGNVLESERLSRFVGQVNELDPDVLVLTGDIFDFDPRHVEDGSRRLGALRARHGVYAVLGNHDVYTGLEHVVGELGRHAPQIRLLRGELVRLPTAAPLYLAGVDDPGRDWTHAGVQLPALDALGRALPDDGPTVLLVHRPEAFPQAAALGFPLVLAGHTHGGQIALPTRSGRLNLARLITNFDRGLYRLGDSLLYVNRGCGFAGPALRVGASREITTFELA